MPILMADEQKEYVISRVKGSSEVKVRLKELGFVPDAHVTIISKNDSGLIVKLFNSCIAIDWNLGSKIEIREVLNENN